MMRRVWLSLILLLFLSISAVSHAEQSIVLPCGLKFGMSMEEAAAVSGFTVNMADGNSVYDAEVRALGLDPVQLNGKVQIGGHDASAEVYFQNDELKQIRYLLAWDSVEYGTKEHDADVLSSWESVGEALKEKYGEPAEAKHAYKNDIVHYYGSNGVNEREVYYYPILENGFIVDTEDGTVYINNYFTSKNDMENTSSYTKYQNVDARQLHYLLYTFYDFHVDEGGDASADF